MVSVKRFQRLALFCVLLLVFEVATAFDADAQRRGGGGFGHASFGHFGYGGRGFAVNRFPHYSFYPRWGSYYGFLPYASIGFLYGGLNYYWCDGIYYRNFDGRYEMVPAPIGYRVGVLPRGCLQLSIGGYPYFYYYGSFYAPVDKQYEVVTAPVGAVVESIPNGADKVEIEGQTYYTVNGVQYKPIMRNNEIWYQVIKSNRSTPPPSVPPQKEQIVPTDSIEH